MRLLYELLTEIKLCTILSYRTKVMKSIDNEVKIPSQISKDSGIIQNHISAVLKQLKEQELVECINPEVRKG